MRIFPHFQLLPFSMPIDNKLIAVRVKNLTLFQPRNYESKSARSSISLWRGCRRFYRLDGYDTDRFQLISRYIGWQDSPNALLSADMAIGIPIWKITEKRTLLPQQNVLLILVSVNQSCCGYNFTCYGDNCSYCGNTLPIFVVSIEMITATSLVCWGYSQNFLLRQDNGVIFSVIHYTCYNCLP